MSHEVLITRGQSIFNFFADPGRGWPQHPRQPAPASTGLLRPASALICKTNQKCLVFWLSGPHGTSKFDHQFLIRSDLNYPNAHGSSRLKLFSFKYISKMKNKTLFQFKDEKAWSTTF